MNLSLFSFELRETITENQEKVNRYVGIILDVK